MAPRIVTVAFALTLAAVSIQAQIHWARHSRNPVFSAMKNSTNSVLIPYYALGPAVLWDPDRNVYLAWFESMPMTAVKFSFSHALSQDGALWYYCAVSPVLESALEGFDSKTMRGPCVIKDGAGYKMYYSASDGSPYTIGLATSHDGVQWEKYHKNPVLRPGPAGSWDHAGVLFCKVLMAGPMYYMWYSGRDGSTSRIGLATSPDGIAWTKHPSNPVLNTGTRGEWDAFVVEDPAVVAVGGLFYMVYTARPELTSQQLGLATSTDGIAWKKYSGNPIFTGQPNWEGRNIAVASLVFRQNTFHLWYSANGSGTWQTGYATSSLEYPLSRRPNPVQNPGFEAGPFPWKFSTDKPGSFSFSSPGVMSSTAAQISIAQQGTRAELSQAGLLLAANTPYTLAFDAYASGGHDLTVSFHEAASPAADHGIVSFDADLASFWQRYKVTFGTGGFLEPATEVRLVFSPHGTCRDQFFIDNVSLTKAIRTELRTDTNWTPGRIPSQVYVRQSYAGLPTSDAMIEIGIPIPCHTSFDLYNTVGQHLANLIGTELPAGRHTIRFDSREFQNGIYLYRLVESSPGGPTAPRWGKMLLLR